MDIKAGISPEELLWQLRAIATTNANCLVQVVDGQLVVGDTGQLSPEQLAAICSVEKSAGSLKVKFYDKLKALEFLNGALLHRNRRKVLSCRRFWSPARR